MQTGFCSSCVATTADDSAGSITVNGIGNILYGSGDLCETCGSVVKTQWLCFLFIPIFPLGTFRIKYVAPERYISRRVRNEREWKAIAKRLAKAGWTWGCTARVDSNGEKTVVADAITGKGERFIVRGDNKLAVFVELESQIRASDVTSRSELDRSLAHSEATKNRRLAWAVAGILAILFLAAILSPRESGDDVGNPGTIPASAQNSSGTQPETTLSPAGAEASDGKPVAGSTSSPAPAWKAIPPMEKSDGDNNPFVVARRQVEAAASTKLAAPQSTLPRKRELTYAPKPRFSPVMHALHLSGSGKFRIYFGSSGIVKQTKVVESTGSNYLDENARATLRTWRAVPGEESQITVPITFRP